MYCSFNVDITFGAEEQFFFVALYKNAPEFQAPFPKKF